MKKIMLAALAFSAAFASPASAVVVFGTTVGGPTFNRPIANGDNPPTDLSLVGTDVSYTLTPFTVSTSGSYTFLLTGLDPVDWDTYLGLYANSFDPGSPLVNALLYNDDNPTIGLSGFTTALTAGTSYIALVTGFANTDAGSYSLDITGPGSVTVGGAPGAVPESSTWAMLIAGFGIVGGALRRRHRGVLALA